MEITLTPEQESLIQHEIENGRIKSAEEAVQQALSVWEERRRDLIELIAPSMKVKRTSRRVGTWSARRSLFRESRRRYCATPVSAWAPRLSELQARASGLPRSGRDCPLHRPRQPRSR